MPTRPLPNNPSLEHLRKEAKRLLKHVHAGDAEARAQVVELHSRAEHALARFSLTDAQLVTARSYRFASWRALKEHLVMIAPFVWNPPPLSNPDARVDRFIRLACLIYGDWHRSNPARALRMLAEDPDLARADIYTASAAGDVATVRAMLESDPARVNRRGGPLRWEPLLYACYSRLERDDLRFSSLEVARLLLANGADPNAGFLWGATYPYTALTGAFGEGEDSPNEPPHPQRDALARLLLEAGADPNDSQALYNRHFREDDGHLTLLLEYGLGRDTGNPWFARQGERRFTPARLLVEELWAAAKNNFPRRVRLLVEHGADVNTPGLRNGRTPYEEALRAGNSEIAEYLLQHGAKRIELDPVEQFALACIAGRCEEARARLAEEPALLEKLGPYGRVELIHRAVDGNHREGVRLIVDLGVDVNGLAPGTGLDRSPLHNAAMSGDLEMVKLLLDLGGNPALRDPTYHGTPIAWAAHSRQQHIVDWLMPAASIFDAVQCDGVERVASLLRADPRLATATDEYGNPVVVYLHADLTHLDEIIRPLIAHGASLDVSSTTGTTLLDRAVARGLTEFADLLRAHGAQGSRVEGELTLPNRVSADAQG